LNDSFQKAVKVHVPVLLLAKQGPESGPSKGGYNMNKFSDEELLELYGQGLTNREIAHELNVSQAAVHYRLEKLGLANNCRSDQDADPEQVKMQKVTNSDPE